MTASASTRVVFVPKGDRRSGTEDEIAIKFTARVANSVLGKDQCKKLRASSWSIDTPEKLDELFELTTARAFTKPSSARL